MSRVGGYFNSGGRAYTQGEVEAAYIAEHHGDRRAGLRALQRARNKRLMPPMSVMVRLLEARQRIEDKTVLPNDAGEDAAVVDHVTFALARSWEHVLDEQARELLKGEGTGEPVGLLGTKEG